MNGFIALLLLQLAAVAPNGTPPVGEVSEQIQREAPEAGKTVQATDGRSAVTAAAVDASTAIGEAEATAAPAADAREEGKLASGPEEISQDHLRWLQEVQLLITEEERKSFLTLARDYQRDAFIRSFWRSRDPYPDTARNELRYRWEERVELARRKLGNVVDRRARVLLLNGEPVLRCARMGSELQPFRSEIWFYRYSDRYSDQFALIFFRNPGARDWELWEPWKAQAGRGQGVQGRNDASVRSPSGRRGGRTGRRGGGGDFDLSGGTGAQIAGRPTGERPGNSISPRVLRGIFGAEIPETCAEASGAASKLIQSKCVRGSCLEYTSLLMRIQTAPTPPNREWLPTFTSFSTEVPMGIETFEAALGLGFPGWYGQRTIFEGVLTVPLSEVSATELGGHRAYNFVLNGEVLRGKELFEHFRYQFNVPATSVDGVAMPLVFQRYLRAGDYTLILRLEDLSNGRFYRTERALSVPTADKTSALSGLNAIDPETARLLEEANAAIAAGESSIRIVKPLGELITGLMRFDTQVIGDTIDKVVFSLDGRPILTKAEPPYSVELDLGLLPRLLTLGATGLDANGKEVASDELIVNAGGYRFVVRLIEPKRGGQFSGAVRARATVEVPEGEALERVEFYLNEELVTTLYGPPLVQTILLPNDEIAYVQVVAYLTNGESVEDAAWINAPGFIDDVDVQFVELYTLVLDKDRRPVKYLTEADFAVREDGVPQEIRRFETVQNRSIRAAILLDTSASMEANLTTAQQAALAFFEQTIEPRDRLGLITFSDRPRLAVKFTNDLAAFGGGLAGLKCEGGTALYDSLIYSLFYFDGVQGQRALLVISDGEDERSRYGFEEALEYAQRAGVTIYTIGIDLARRETGIRRRLNRLASETGGRGFFIDSINELEDVYRVIQEELRSRYLIAYQSTNSERDDRFRGVEVDVSGRGLEASTLRGYFP